MVFAAKLLQIKEDRKTIAMHNGSFDCKFLWANGVEIENEFDTMVAAYLLTDRPVKLSLDALASYYLGLPSWKSDLKSAFEDPELMRLYCIKDCQVTAQLAEVLEKRLIEEGKLDFFYKLMAARRMLTRAEYHGFAFDVQACEDLIKELTAQYEHELKELNRLGGTLVASYPKISKAGFNWNSPTQIKWLLKDALKLNTVNPLTKKESADAFVLELNQNKHPLIPHILQMRDTKKKISTLEGYLEYAKDTGALYTNFNCTNTITGRLSSSGQLNLQQTPRDKRFRSLFKARLGHKLVIGDLGQIEPRLAAHYSKDPILCGTFIDKLDLYGSIAVQLLGADCHPNEVKTKYPEKRAVAKVVALSVLYGIGSHKLCTTIQNDGGIKDFTVHQAKQVIDDYFEKFPSLKTLQMGVHKRITQTGHLVNLEGRKVDVDESKVHRDGVNSLLQSSASDFLLFKVVEFEKTLIEKYNGHVLALVHDEVIVSVPENKAKECAKELTEFIENVQLRVPIKFECSVGDTWASKS
jgi:DNA polymerase-1